MSHVSDCLMLAVSNKKLGVRILIRFVQNELHNADDPSVPTGALLINNSAGLISVKRWMN